MNILISIIVPIYNVKKYLDRCIESLINQTYKNLEIILIDDGSIDGSGKICDKFTKTDNRIKAIHQKNQGVSVARNQGIINAKGEYIMFVDADDYIDKKCCEVILRYLNKNIDFLKFNFVKSVDINYQDNINYKYIEFDKFNKNILILNALGYNKNLINFNIINVWGGIYKKSFIVRNNIYFDKNLKIGEDLLFSLYIYENMNNGICINYEGYNYTDNKNSMTKKFNKDKLKIDRSFSKALKTFINKYNLEEEYKNAYAYSILNGLIICLREWFSNNENKLNYISKRKMIIRFANNKLYISAYYKIKNKLNLKKRIILKLYFDKYLEVIYILYKIKNLKKE